MILAEGGATFKDPVSMAGELMVSDKDGEVVAAFVACNSGHSAIAEDLLDVACTQAAWDLKDKVIFMVVQITQHRFCRDREEI